MELLSELGKIILFVFGILTFYKTIYCFIGFFVPKKVFKKTNKKYKYGIIIAARNEEKVIGNLIDSIKNNTYKNYSIFVIADNCNDKTASICRNKGAIVYERNNKKKMRKGYALEYLFDRISEDYGILSFDGYMFFDADNLLHPLFIEKMNDAFHKNKEAVVGYRNTKNFNRNFISAGYGIHFYRSVMTYHRPRAFLNLSTHLAGTGYLINSKVFKDGFHYTTLTEDTEFTLKNVSKGLLIDFCEEAIFYDEQPYEFKVMIRQRLRWIKGRLVSFFITVPNMLKGIFKCKKRKFSCYDMFFYSFPMELFKTIISILFLIISTIILIINNQFNLDINILKTLFLLILTNYIGSLIMGIIVVIRERKMINCSNKKLIINVLLWPYFDLTSLPIALISLFMKVKWRPIKHDEDIKINELIN